MYLGLCLLKCIWEFLQLLAITKKAITTIYIYVFIGTHAFISLGEIPRSETAGSHGKNMFNLLRNYKSIFQIGSTISHSDQF